MDHSAERGIALPIALFGLIVIGALVAGSFFAGTLEQQSGRSSTFSAQAIEAAEAGLRQAVAGANRSVLAALVPGGPAIELETLEVGQGIGALRQVSRLTDSLFFIRSTGIRHNPAGAVLAVRSLGLIVRLAAPLSPLAERSWIELN